MKEILVLVYAVFWIVMSIFVMGYHIVYDGFNQPQWEEKHDIQGEAMRSRIQE
jgi:uncharacterized protein YxeA